VTSEKAQRRRRRALPTPFAPAAEAEARHQLLARRSRQRAARLAREVAAVERAATDEAPPGPDLIHDVLVNLRRLYKKTRAGARCR
jgi:hypothetical protein